MRIDALRGFAEQKDITAGPIILELLKRDKLGEQFKVTVMQAISRFIEWLEKRQPNVSVPTPAL